MHFPNDQRKATDAVARLIQKSGAVDYLRISKLIYLADRISILTRGIPIVGGQYFSMKKGPVISEIMDAVNQRTAPKWKEVISPRRGNILTLLRPPDLDSLTADEIAILDRVVEEHFNRSTDDLVQWCHDNCGEYETVIWSKRKPIQVETILEVEGKSKEHIEKISSRAKELEELQELLG